MENKSHALVAGIFTVVLLTAAVFAGWWLQRDRVGQMPFEIATNLQLPGLRPQAFVRYRGLNVGRVTDIQFNRKVAGEILIHMEINPETPVTESTFAVLGHQGVTGIAFIELNDNGEPGERLISSNDHLVRIEMRPGLFSSLNDRALVVLEQVQNLSNSLNTLFKPDNQKMMLDTIQNIGDAAKGVDQMTKKLEPTLIQLPGVATRMEKTIESVAVLSKNVNDLSGSLNTFVSHSLEGEILPRTSLVMDNARTSLNAISTTLDQLNQQPTGLLFGTSSPAPGPGEAGFVPPNK